MSCWEGWRLSYVTPVATDAGEYGWLGFAIDSASDSLFTTFKLAIYRHRFINGTPTAQCLRNNMACIFWQEKRKEASQNDWIEDRVPLLEADYGR